MILEGIIKKIVHYRAFIDLGEIDGLFHKSTLSPYKFMRYSSEILANGHSLQVKKYISPNMIKLRNRYKFLVLFTLCKIILLRII